MTAHAGDLIAEVHKAGGTIRRDGDVIDLHAPAPLPAELVARIREAKPAVLAILAEIERPIISPARWAGATSDGPSFEEPCPERHGRIERQGAMFLHFCVECGRWGAYGYGATLSQPGRWYCRLHRPA
jgi:hypothetical protein